MINWLRERERERTRVWVRFKDIQLDLVESANSAIRRNNISSPISKFSTYFRMTVGPVMFVGTLEGVAVPPLQLLEVFVSPSRPSTSPPPPVPPATIPALVTDVEVEFCFAVFCCSP